MFCKTVVAKRRKAFQIKTYCETIKYSKNHLSDQGVNYLEIMIKEMREIEQKQQFVSAELLNLYMKG